MYEVQFRFALVPEPSTLTLLGLGSLALVILRRRDSKPWLV
jgi:hypothetical protein